ncbi:MAG: autotransporter domain-containing protein, partial [Akkermansia sp.]|nr:autotransporter domain-containing protein [Akkermansia sp.]
KVEDSANFVGGGFATADAANAKVELKNATFDHGTNEVKITSGSSLVINNSATLSAGTLTMAAGSTLTFNALVDTTTAEQGVLGGTIGSASIGGTVNVALSFDSDYLQSISEETALTIKLVGATTLTWNDTPGTLTYEGLDSLVWDTEALKLAVKDNALYVTGSLARKGTVEVENGGEIGSDIAGDTKVTVGGDVTISGNNSHEGGTVIGDADGTDNTANVTLGSNNALGNGGVTVEDGVDATIGTDDGVTAVLPSTGIENKGTLTLNGSYDASNLDEETGEGDTRVCVDGKEGNNGYLRDGDTVITVVENKGNGSLIVGDDTVITKDGDKLHLAESGKAGALDYSHYHIVDEDHAPSVGAIQDMRPDSEAGNDLTIAMSGGSLTVKDSEVLATNTKVEATGGTIKTEGNVTIGGDQYEITGTTSISVEDGAEVTLKGNNDHTGETLVANGSKLTVEDAAALGNSSVKLDVHGKLDLNGKAVKNYIDVKGCELHNASAYDGNIDVSGDLTICGTDATANKVTMIGTGTLNRSASETVTLNAIEMASGASGQLHVDLVVRDGGSIILNDGNMLRVDGSLTLGNGTVFVLNGDEYGKDSVLVAEATTYSGATTGTASLSYGYGTYALVNGQIVLTHVFNQRYADLFTAGNWGMAAASRAFVDTVRGQRTNTGCIANGRGTAWAAVLMGTNDIAGADIDLKGAAVGVDMKVGEKHNLGVALGYVEGDTKAKGWSALDQTSTYLAVYGEHGLRKLSDTSCLSLDWVLAYGQGESEINSTSWEQDSLQLNTRLSWNKKLSDKLCLSVFGGLEYYTNESDEVAGMKTGSIQNLRGEVGVGASYVVWGVPGSETVTDEKGAEITVTGTGCRRLVLHGEVRVMNDMVRHNPVIRMDGLSGSGENPGRTGMGIEAGATYRVNDRWSASANYSFNAMDDSREHCVNVGASYTF